MIKYVFYMFACCMFLRCGQDGCDPDHSKQWKREQHERWEGDCADQAVLVATTSGSPNDFTCWNKSHVMRVEVATRSTNEEAAAIVFCECKRDRHE